MQVKAKLNNLRIAPRKVRLVADLIRGMEVNSAIFQLKNLNKKSASYLVTLVKSAISNAENNFNLKKNELFIKHITIDEDVTYKRWQPRAFGRSNQLRKRGSKVNIVLEDREAKSVKSIKS
ncbi:50S ribosomal protein L22 [Patescibacteria group bacterium]